MLVRGPYESRDRYLSNKKNGSKKITAVSVNGSGFSCLNFNGEFMQFHAWNQGSPHGNQNFSKLRKFLDFKKKLEDIDF